MRWGTLRHSNANTAEAPLHLSQGTLLSSATHLSYSSPQPFQLGIAIIPISQLSKFPQVTELGFEPGMLAASVPVNRDEEGMAAQGNGEAVR